MNICEVPLLKWSGESSNKRYSEKCKYKNDSHQPFPNVCHRSNQYRLP